jgi:hypothetical protein
MPMSRRALWIFAGCAAALGVAACTRGTAAVPPDCQGVTGAQLACPFGLVGYACANAARPDEDGLFVDGVPRGLVCTDEGAIASDGADGGDAANEREGFCCTAAPTPCVLDPVAGCAAPFYGYQCRGSDRPESFDATLYCGEGRPEGNLVDYCCGAGKLPAGCAQATNPACPGTLVGWSCTDLSLPSEAELGSNQSRADFELLLCSVPTVTTTAAGAQRQYCCFTPTAAPAGASCVEDTTVAGCPPGNFGFACTGADAPGSDFPRMTCGAGTAGRSAEGYAATLYCCTFE